MIKTRIYILILILALPFFMVEIILSIQLKWVKSEVKEMLIHSLNPNELVEFRMSPTESSQLNWINDHEFSIDGLMYDVVSRSDDESEILFVCFPDKQETELNERLDEMRMMAWGRHIPSKKNQAYFISFMKNMFFHNSPSVLPSYENFKTHSSPYSYFDSKIEMSIFLPPPEYKASI